MKTVSYGLKPSTRFIFTSIEAQGSQRTFQHLSDDYEKNDKYRQNLRIHLNFARKRCRIR